MVACSSETSTTKGQTTENTTESTNVTESVAPSGEPGDEVALPTICFGDSLAQTKDYVVTSFTYTDGEETISGYCKIKAQGNSSMAYPKKNQTVKFYADAECNEKLELEFNDWGAQSKFCLKANWIDITHSRNIVSAQLWGDVVRSRDDYDNLPEELRASPNQGAIDGFPILVYADGVYQGRYTLNIPKDAWMVNMDEDNPNHCIIMGEVNDGAAYFRETALIDGSDWSDEIHDEVPDSILTRWNEIIDWVQNSTDDEFRTELSNYFDVQSLIDYYLFSLASCNYDGFGKNQMFLTYDGVIWYTTVYDLDATWGLWWDGEYFVPVDYSSNPSSDGNLLYYRLSQLFQQELKTRWVELRSNVLSEEHIIERFESFIDLCPEELVAEDYSETTANGAFTEIPSVDTNSIEQIRSFVMARLLWSDLKMGIDNGTPEGINQIPLAQDESGAVYNGCGYKLNTILYDEEVSHKTIGTTGFIPCTTGQIVRLANLSFENSGGDCRIYFYDENKNEIGLVVANASYYMEQSFLGITDENGNYTTIYIKEIANMTAGCAYIRICCNDMTDQSVITVSNLIKNDE